MIDPTLIRPDYLYESEEACSLCGRQDVRAFLAAIQKVGFRPAHRTEIKYWEGKKLLAFLGIPGYESLVNEAKEEATRQQIRDHWPKTKKEKNPE